MGQILAGALGGLGFSIVFGVRKKYMALIALNAGLSWAVYLAVNALAGDFAGNMASAMFCSLMAAVLARRIKVPTVVLQMPATVPIALTLVILTLGALAVSADFRKTVYTMIQKVLTN